MSAMSDLDSSGLDRLTASLRVYSPNLDPERVTKALKVQPQWAWRKGESVRGRPAVVGMWCLELESEPPDPIDAIRKLLAATSGDTAAWQSLRADYEIDIFFGVWMASDNAAFSIPSDLMMELAVRGVSVAWDVYESVHD